MPMFVTVMTLFASQFLGSTNQPRNRSAACGAARLRNRISFKVSTSCTQSATTRLPAARMTSPVIQADSSDARNTASGAISLTRPSRPSGVLSARTAAAPSECAVEDCRIWRQHHVWHRLQPYIEMYRNRSVSGAMDRAVHATVSTSRQRHEYHALQLLAAWWGFKLGEGHGSAPAATTSAGLVNADGGPNRPPSALLYRWHSL